VVLSTGPGNVDAAVMGTDRGIAGEGVLAAVTFRAKASGDPRVLIAGLDARDRGNRKVDLAIGTIANPKTTAFSPATPNPARGTTTLSWSLARAGAVELVIYSVDGRRVRTMDQGAREAGVYRLTWDGTDDGGRAVPPGLFYARLITPDGRFTRTLVLLD
jgi:hypothetical protein